MEKTIINYNGVEFIKESSFFADGSERINTTLSTAVKSHTTAGVISEMVVVASGVEFDDFQRIETPQEVIEDASCIINEIIEDAVNTYGMDLLAVEIFNDKYTLNRESLKNYLEAVDK